LKEDLAEIGITVDVRVLRGAEVLAIYPATSAAAPTTC
jgi:hypothetical protein